MKRKLNGVTHRLPANLAEPLRALRQGVDELRELADQLDCPGVRRQLDSLWNAVDDLQLAVDAWDVFGDDHTYSVASNGDDCQAAASEEKGGGA